MAIRPNEVSNERRSAFISVPKIEENTLSESSYLFLNGLRVHYLHWNLDGAGTPVVLLHGLASNARIWERTAPFLVEWGYTMLAPDLRGHGLSDKPDGDYGFDTFAADLSAFLGAFDLGRPVLVGHSWGAMLALDLAARNPVGPRAPLGVALVDGGLNQLDASGQTWEQVRERLTPPRLAGTPLDEFLARLKVVNPRWQPSEADIQIILANFEIGEDDTISPRLSFEHHMQIVRAMWEFQTYQRLQQVRCPVLAVPAVPAEPRTPAEAEFLAYKEHGALRAQQVLPGLKLHWMEDTIHDIPLQRPEALAGLISDFIGTFDVHPAPRRR